ncbi:hypothetical protein [Laceyella putida]|uniref:Uncharacterized protein n=1 Tax=Laceyella putida TaxID=110101 RepID=A0ABW2RNZ4_9BACL
MCGEQTIKGIVDPIFFRSDLQFFGEVWNNQAPEARLFLKFLIERDMTRARQELDELLQNGLDFLKKLDGPFILVYFDRKRKKGFLYRSLLCKAPLYYRKRGRQWLWSMALPDLLEADRSALAQVEPDRVLISYLQGGLPETASFYRDIHRVPAGGLARYEDERIQVSVFDVPLPQPHLNKWRTEDLMSFLHDTMVKRLIWRKSGRQEEKVGVLLSDGEQGAATVSLLKPFASGLVAYMIKEKRSLAEIALARRIAHGEEVPCVILEWDGTVPHPSVPATWLPSFYLAAPYLHYWREHCVRDEVTRLCYDAVFTVSGLRRRKSALRLYWEGWQNKQRWWRGMFSASTLFTKEAKERLLVRERELQEQDPHLWPLQCWLNEEDALFYAPFWLEKGLRFFYPALSREWLEVAISIPGKHVSSLQLLQRWNGHSSALPAPLATSPAPWGRFQQRVPPYEWEWTGRQWLHEHPHLAEWQWIDPDRLIQWWEDGRKRMQLWDEILWMMQIGQWLSGLERLTVD